MATPHISGRFLLGTLSVRVIPAEAGIQLSFITILQRKVSKAQRARWARSASRLCVFAIYKWIPAFAGMMGGWMTEKRGINYLIIILLCDTLQL